MSPLKRAACVMAITGPVALASIAGCGDGGNGTPADIIRTFARAVADGDGKTACGLMMGPAQRSLVLFGSCAATIQTASDGYGDEEKAALRSVVVAKVRVEGDRATVEDGTSPQSKARFRPTTTRITSS